MKILPTGPGDFILIISQDGKMQTVLPDPTGTLLTNTMIATMLVIELMSEADKEFIEFVERRLKERGEKEFGKGSATIH